MPGFSVLHYLSLSYIYMRESVLHTGFLLLGFKILD